MECFWTEIQQDCIDMVWRIEDFFYLFYLSHAWYSYLLLYENNSTLLDEIFDNWPWVEVILSFWQILRCINLFSFPNNSLRIVLMIITRKGFVRSLHFGLLFLHIPFTTLHFKIIIPSIIKRNINSQEWDDLKRRKIYIWVNIVKRYS